MDNRRTWVANVGIYTMSNVLNAAIPFLLLPILTDYLSPSDYGVLSSLNALIAVMVPLVGLNLMSSLQVVYIKQVMDFDRYISTGLVTMYLLTGGCTVLLFFFGDSLAILLKLPPKFLYFIAIYAMYQNAVETLLSVWRMCNKAVAYGWFRVGRTALELSLALILIVVFDCNYEGAMVGLIYSYGIAAALAVYFLFRDYGCTLYWERSHFFHLLQYGGKLIPHVLGGMVMVYADKLVIAHFLGQAENGIYAVGFTVAQVIGLLQNSFNQAWSPWAMQQLKREDVHLKGQMVKWTYVYFIAILLAVFIFYLCSPLIFSVLGSQFARGSEMVLYIALGFAFNGMYKMISVYYFYAERTGWLSIITLFTAALNILLLMYWVPAYGYFGASLAMLTAFFVQFVISWWGSVRIIKMPWLLKY